jgi:hypothetical protein
MNRAFHVIVPQRAEYELAEILPNTFIGDKHVGFLSYRQGAARRENRRRMSPTPPPRRHSAVNSARVSRPQAPDIAMQPERNLILCANARRRRLSRIPRGSFAVTAFPTKQ